MNTKSGQRSTASKDVKNKLGKSIYGTDKNEKKNIRLVKTRNVLELFIFSALELELLTATAGKNKRTLHLCAELN